MSIGNWIPRLRNQPESGTAQVRYARLAVESLETRDVPYAVSGNLWPNAQLITVSFVPDGTMINGVASNLQATFNAKFGSAATWQNVFKEAAQVWAQQTNINFNFVTDNGTVGGGGSNQQGDPGFGDIRIGGYNFGNTTLAQAFLPPSVNNYSIAGDIAFNTSQTFNIGSAYNLFTVATHEIGHALGLQHGLVGSIMASAYPGTLTALTADDISGIKAIYSAGAARAKDSYDTTAANETFATATLITSTINTTSKTANIANMDLSTSTDVDWYKFVIPTGSATTLKVKAVATGLSLLNPKIEIYNSSNVVKATGNGTGYGSTATATYSGVAAGQTWYVKVSSADAKAAFKTGKYALVLNMGTGADPVVALPNTLKANGNPLTSGGGVAVSDGIETLVNTASTNFSAGAKSSMTVASMDGSTTPVQITNGEPAIAIDAAGNYVVVWENSGQDGSGAGIFAQRFNSLGIAQGLQFQVNLTTSGDQTAPAVAMGTNGDFVITWVSSSQDGSGTGIYAQRFNALGVAQGSEFRVNTTTANDQITPAIGVDTSGNFVIAWSSYGQDTAGSWGIYAQRFNSTGTALGSEYLVSTTTANDQINPVIAMNNRLTVASSPNYEILWSSYNQDAANSWGVYGQRYNSSGLVQGSEFRVNNTTAGDQKLSGASIDANGNFNVVWTSTGQDGDQGGIYSAKFNSAGTILIGEYRVNTTTVGDQTNASVISDRYGNYYVVWQSYNQDSSGSWGVYGQQFTAGGNPVEKEFKVNSSVAGDQVNPTAAMDSSGHLVVVWNGAGTLASDAVYLQRYSINTALELPPEGDIYDPEGHDHDHEIICHTETESSVSTQSIAEASTATDPSFFQQSIRFFDLDSDVMANEFYQENIAEDTDNPIEPEAVSTSLADLYPSSNFVSPMTSDLDWGSNLYTNRLFNLLLNEFLNELVN